MTRVIGARHRRIRPFATFVALAAALLAPPLLLADGGQVRVSQVPAGPFLVTVFTSPIPLRTGHIDVSVLLQDRETKDPVHDANITVTAEPMGHEGQGGTYPATRAQATNKLFQAAEFDIEGAGTWRFTVAARNGRGEGTVHFDVDVKKPGLLDRGVWVWVLLAIPIVIVLWLLTRSDERRATVEPDEET
ncbi:MAG TPA: hypothetical protein VJ957_02565 [Longimicrobiales bacterium]|nr:hypothetical protein [Longimicrobiales bacterium]